MQIPFPLAAASHLNKTYTLVAAKDAMLDTSVTRFSPSDCQRPEVLNRKLVEGKILLCGYSFNFVVGSASIKKVSETARSLGAAGFVLAVENVTPGTKFDPVPSSIPGIVVTDVRNSLVNLPEIFLSFIIMGWVLMQKLHPNGRSFGLEVAHGHLNQV